MARSRNMWLGVRGPERLTRGPTGDLATIGCVCCCPFLQAGPYGWTLFAGPAKPGRRGEVPALMSGRRYVRPASQTGQHTRRRNTPKGTGEAVDPSAGTGVFARSPSARDESKTTDPKSNPLEESADIC